MPDCDIPEVLEKVRFLFSKGRCRDGKTDLGSTGESLFTFGKCIAHGSHALGIVTHQVTDLDSS